MRIAGRTGRTVVLRLRFDDFSRATRSHTLPYPTAQHQDDPRHRARPARAATPLIEQRGITLVGVAVGNLGEGRSFQPMLPFEQDTDALDAALDEVRLPIRLGGGHARRAARPRAARDAAAAGLVHACKANICSLYLRGAACARLARPPGRHARGTRPADGRRGRPVALRTPSISDGLACSLLDELTAGDSRVVCIGAQRRAGRRAPRSGAGGGRVRRLRPRDDRPLGRRATASASSAPCGCARSSSSTRSSRSSTRGSRCPSRSRG